jgi:HD superfamily phosphohydrolase
MLTVLGASYTTAAAYTAAAIIQRTPPQSRTITDAIHHSIELHPLVALVVDSSEFQRLRGIHQLGSCRYVFPSAVHDRFQHSLGVSHLSREWAEHFQRLQPELAITDTDILCVSLAGLLHDLGHGPMSHFWETLFEDVEARPRHEDLSHKLVARLFRSIDASSWLSPDDLEFVQALIAGEPTPGLATHAAMRLGDAGVCGSDKGFLYDIVANKRSGLDVDKLDYFERDSYFAGVVKVSFDAGRLMRLARVALADEGRLRVCFPIKCLHEVLHVFQTRYALHVELYQHRVTAAIDLMLRDAIELVDASDVLRLHGRDGQALRLSECGGAKDDDLVGFLQLNDGILQLVEFEATRAVYMGVHDERLQAASKLLARLRLRQLYRFVGSVVLEAGEVRRRGWGTRAGLLPIVAEIAELTTTTSRATPIPDTSLRVNVRRVHYGRGAENPLEGVRFFDKNQRGGVSGAGLVSNAASAPAGQGSLLHARREPSAEHLAMLPQSFEEESLRLYVTETHADAVTSCRAAFDAWCELQGWCNDECVLDAAPPQL